MISVHTPRGNKRRGSHPFILLQGPLRYPERAFALKPREPACVETVEFAEGCPMPATLRTTPCEIRDDLYILRRMVAARGHIETIQGIDALIGIAEAEAIKVIRRIDRAA
ncbi:Uncharacterized protein MLTONO_1479 [Mesorhizobium loti]|nr:Uncharacterized protein MLTONO_1479 [Mesorhizobium loti]